MSSRCRGGELFLVFRGLQNQIRYCWLNFDPIILYEKTHDLKEQLSSNIEVLQGVSIELHPQGSVQLLFPNLQPVESIWVNLAPEVRLQQNLVHRDVGNIASSVEFQIFDPHAEYIPRDSYT